MLGHTTSFSSWYSNLVLRRKDKPETCAGVQVATPPPPPQQQGRALWAQPRRAPAAPRGSWTPQSSTASLQALPPPFILCVSSSIPAAFQSGFRFRAAEQG